MVYLGSRVCKVQLENGVWAWSFSSSQYVQSAIKNVEEYIGRPENSHLKIPSKAETPLTTSYRPELDVSSELMPRDLTENVPKTLSKAPCLVTKRMSLTLHLLLFKQSMCVLIVIVLMFLILMKGKIYTK